MDETTVEGDRVRVSRFDPSRWYYFLGLVAGIVLIALFVWLAASAGVPGTDGVREVVPEEGLFATLLTDLGIAASWIVRLSVYGAVLAGGLWAVRRIRREMRPGARTEFVLIDRSSAGRGQRAASHALVHEVVDACRRRIDSMDAEVFKLEMSALPSPVAADGVLARLNERFDDQAVSVGPISFSPRELYHWIAGLFRRPAERVVLGNLAGGDGRYHMVGEVSAHSGESSRELRVDASGDNARREVVEAFALRLLVELGGGIASQDPDSECAYFEGFGLLRDAASADDVSSVVAKARERLEEAVSIDPENVSARLLLGELLNNRQESEIAVQHFKWVRDLLAEYRDSERGPHRSVAACPAIEWRCRYQLVSARARIISREEWKQAHAEVLLLGAERHESLDEVGLYLRTAHALVRLQEMEVLRNEQRVRPVRKESFEQKMNALREKISLAESWLWRHYVDLRSRWPDAVGRAHSVLQYACGRAHYLCADDAEAQRYLQWVVTIYRPTLDSRPYTYLAAVLIRRREHAGANWRHRVQGLLMESLKINPYAERPNYMMAKLMAEDPGSDAAEADRYYARNGGAMSRYWRGRLWIERLDQEAGGLDLIRQSLKADKAVDARVSWFAHYLAVKFFGGDESVRPELEKWIQRLRQSGKERWREWATETEIRLASVLIPKPPANQRTVRTESVPAKPVTPGGPAAPPPPNPATATPPTGPA